MASQILCAERLREVLSYNPETGVFHWKVRAAYHVRIGTVAGSLNSQGYLHTRVDGKRFLNHRLAWLFVHGTWPSGDIDHINGCRSDNRIANLRDVQRSINAQNLRTAQSNNKSTGLLGAYKQGRRWCSIIMIDGKQRYLGTFDTPEEAHTAYLETKRKFHPGCTI